MSFLILNKTVFIAWAAPVEKNTLGDSTSIRVLVDVLVTWDGWLL